MITGNEPYHTNQPDESDTSHPSDRKKLDADAHPSSPDSLVRDKEGIAASQARLGQASQ
jgi:hypothetical protein